MIEQVVFDKRDWKDGPWKNECDYAWWIDPNGHYPCVARRNIFGAWCGFVGVDVGHTLFQTHETSEELVFVEIHGDVSFSGWLPDEDKRFEPAVKRWWFGFDCMQDGDMMPVFWAETRKKSKLVYRNYEYVKRQVELLALQLFYFDTRIEHGNL